MSSDEPLLRTIPESAAQLRLSKATVWRMIADGRLAAVRTGGSTRVKQSELRRFVEGLEPART